MGDSLRVQFFTPDALLFAVDASEVVAPGSMGEFGVLPNHINFASTLEAGRVLVRTQAGEKIVAAVRGGYLEVTDDSVTVLADGAQMAAAIDAEQARRDLVAAERSLAEAQPGEQSYHEALIRLAEAKARMAAVSERDK